MNPTMTAATKTCLACGEVILEVARKCRNCHHYLDPSARPTEATHGTLDRLLIPVDRPASAVAAGYLALFSFIPAFGLPMSILALVFGIMALKKINADPKLVGRGRAWFGIIVGGLMTVVNVLLLILVIIGMAMEANR